MESVERDNYEQEDDLEKVLLLAAVNADKRNNICLNDDEVKSTSSKQLKYENTKSVNEQSPGEHTKVVAQHYNALEEKGLDERYKSRIFYMRNFNNWIKSKLINEYLTKVREHKCYRSQIKVLDMCCGKGGDLLKWRKGNISYLICSDIASLSVEQCEMRYKTMFNYQRYHHNNQQQKFSAEFIAADLTKQRLREQYKDKTIELDLVSCQFSFHYSFESLSQAECMLQNASECLTTGGYFIGTIPDANELLNRQRAAGSKSYGNSIYNVTFQCDTDKPPIFGAKYDFQLEGVVNCPEFLVHFPTFVKLAAKYGLKLIQRERFDAYYERMRHDGLALMIKMQALETYPAKDGDQLVGDLDDYQHAEQYLQANQCESIGTLSLPEWEAATLYLTFAFQKQKRIGWTKEGKPEYLT